MKQRWKEETGIISLLGLVVPVGKHFSFQSYLSVPQAPSVKKDKAVDKNSISKKQMSKCIVKSEKNLHFFNVTYTSTRQALPLDLLFIFRYNVHSHQNIQSIINSSSYIFLIILLLHVNIR
jgi:hypothetical protein